ncbi:uncharacterized protein LOC119995602 [Tripterygium wilfordii]|uniref:uncharacterized protein LOC119995602 n=1 Tax=Tripterygium wilfordii TaxID=458696 RepID=UPI0018F83462|nr:uncharacterized protein LOC119995602 [Tripterygium wilfordii]
MAMELFSESPRISFSHDLSQFEIVPIEQRHPYRSNSPSNSIDFDFRVRRSSDHEYNKLDNGEEAEQNKASNSKSFWKFKKSRSVNCGSGYGRGFCPLPLLSRSNSTGSAPNSVKRPPLISKDAQKQSTQRNSSSSFSSPIISSQKPPLRKSSYVSSYGNNGVRVNPVLNVSSGNLFGLGSMFFHGSKEKSKKK